MVEDVEELPAKLSAHRLLLHPKRRRLFHQGAIEIGKSGTDHGVPSQIAEGIRLIGLESGRIEELRYSFSAWDGVRIAHQIRTIRLTGVSGIAVDRNVVRVSRGEGQNTAETPAAQDCVHNGVQTGAESPAPSLAKIRRILKRRAGSRSFRTEASDIA